VSFGFGGGVAYGTTTAGRYSGYGDGDMVSLVAGGGVGSGIGGALSFGRPYGRVSGNGGGEGAWADAGSGAEYGDWVYRAVGRRLTVP
jgi:hypothetical protein